MSRAATPLDQARGITRLHMARSRLKSTLQRADRHSSGLVTDGVLQACLAEAAMPISAAVLQEALRKFSNGGGQVRWADLVKNLAVGRDPAGDPVIVIREKNKDAIGATRRPCSAASSASSASGFLPRPRPSLARPRTQQLRGGDAGAGPGLNGLTSENLEQMEKGRGGGFRTNSNNRNNDANINDERWETGSIASSIRSRGRGRPRSVASSRPGTALSVLRKGLVGEDEQRRLDAKYDALWDAFRAQDPEDSDHLHVEQLRQVLEYHGSAFSVISEDVEAILAQCDVGSLERVNYAQFLTKMIQHDMPAPKMDGYSARARGELDRSTGRRSLQRMTMSKDLYELRQFLHHPRFSKQRALRQRFLELDPDSTGRLLRSDVIRETMDANITTISRYSLHRLVDNSGFRLSDETVDYNIFILSMIRSLRNVPASEADNRNGESGGPDGHGSSVAAERRKEKANSERQSQAKAKLTRLRNYLQLADERGLGRITAPQFAKVLSLMGLASSPTEVDDLVSQYLDKYTNRIDVNRFIAQIEAGKFSLDGATLDDADRDLASSGALRDLNLTRPGVKVPPAKFAGVDPQLPPHRVLHKPRPSRTPDTTPYFDDQDDIQTPVRHRYRKKNPLLQDPAPTGRATRRLLDVPSDHNSEYVYGVEHDHGAESMAAVISHGYLRGHMEKRRQREENRRLRKIRENKRFHTRATMAAMEAASRGRGAREETVEERPLFKIRKFEKAKPKVDNRRR